MNMTLADVTGLLKRKDGEVVEYQRPDTQFRVFQRVRFPDSSVRPCYIDIPDYGNNLDAIHEAETKLTNEQRRYYVKVLVSVHPLKYSPFEGDDNWMKVFFLVHATASQRREAILKSVGRWWE